MIIPLEIGASVIFSIIAVFVAIKVSAAKADVKIEMMEKQVAKNSENVANALTAIAKRDEEMKDVHRRLNKIDDLKLEANIAEIKKDLQHIRALLESKD